jgi:hypothetical protein
MELTHLGTLKTLLSEVLLLSREQRRFRHELRDGLERLWALPADASKLEAKIAGASSESSTRRSNVQEYKSDPAGAGIAESDSLRATMDAVLREMAGLQTALKRTQEAVLPVDAKQIPCQPPEKPPATCVTEDTSSAPKTTTKLAGASSSVAAVAKAFSTGVRGGVPGLRSSAAAGGGVERTASALASAPTDMEYASVVLVDRQHSAKSLSSRHSVSLQSTHQGPNEDSAGYVAASFRSENGNVSPASRSSQHQPQAQQQPQPQQPQHQSQPIISEPSRNAMHASIASYNEQNSGVKEIISEADFSLRSEMIAALSATEDTSSAPEISKKMTGASSPLAAVAERASAGVRGGGSGLKSSAAANRRGIERASAPSEMELASVVLVDRQQMAKSLSSRRSASFHFTHPGPREASERSVVASFRSESGNVSPAARSSQENSKQKQQQKPKQPQSPQQQHQSQPIVSEPSRHAMHTSNVSHEGQGNDVQGLTPAAAGPDMMRAVHRRESPARSLGVDDLPSSFKAWSRRRLEFRPDGGCASGSSERGGLAAEDSLESINSFSDPSAEGGWIAALAAAVDDDETTSCAGLGPHA